MREKHKNNDVSTCTRFSLALSSHVRFPFLLGRLLLLRGWHTRQIFLSPSPLVLSLLDRLDVPHGVEHVMILCVTRSFHLEKEKKVRCIRQAALHGVVSYRPLLLLQRSMTMAGAETRSHAFSSGFFNFLCCFKEGHVEENASAIFSKPWFFYIENFGGDSTLMHCFYGNIAVQGACESLPLCFLSLFLSLLMHHDFNCASPKNVPTLSPQTRIALHLSLSSVALLSFQLLQHTSLLIIIYSST